jgi:hypothetical protein
VDQNCRYQPNTGDGQQVQITKDRRTKIAQTFGVLIKVFATLEGFQISIHVCNNIANPD